MKTPYATFQENNSFLKKTLHINDGSDKVNKTLFKSSWCA